MFKKLLQNHRLLLGLVFGILFAVPTYLFAQELIPLFYQVSTGSTIFQKTADDKNFSITNLSSRDLFIPNKTMNEWLSFYKNNPNYTSISFCGDGACTSGETTSNCLVDCPNRAILTGFCGDGYCDLNKEKPGSAALNSITVYPITVDALGNPVPGGDYEICITDCGMSYNTCGVCGTDAQGNICANHCSDNGFNFINCSQASDGNDPTTLSGTLLSGDDLILNLIKDDNYQYLPEGTWYCSNGALAGGCTAGNYCSTGISRPCPAGFFCPAGEYYPRSCPPGTYSTGGSSVCTACPTGSLSQAQSTSSGACFTEQICGDGIKATTPSLNYDIATIENRASCPQDSIVLGDGYCHIFEHGMSSPDCMCGDSICNNGESNAVCPQDCPSCGDGACHASEVGVCYSDCPVCNNNGVCQSEFGETPANCSNDCRCGNGVCEGAETVSNCFRDCHCGDNICQIMWGETASSCSSDCRCGDGICDPTEISLQDGSSNSYQTTCLSDCQQYITY